MTDATANRFPVSVKAIIQIGDRLVLRKNERDEWELPGGKLEPSESIEACILREIEEELSIKTSIAGLVNVWLYQVNEVEVVIITYAMNRLEADVIIRPEFEHEELKLFSAEDVLKVNMPDGYKRSIDLYLKGDMGDRR